MLKLPSDTFIDFSKSTDNYFLTLDAATGEETEATQSLRDRCNHEYRLVVNASEDGLDCVCFKCRDRHPSGIVFTDDHNN